MGNGEHIEEQNLDQVKTEFRKLYYSSLLQQRQENATNRIKIAAISIGITIAGVFGIIGKEIESFSNLLLLFLIFTISYVPWLHLIYVAFRKLEIDDKVIDEKVSTIGKAEEYADTKSKPLADKFEKKFRRCLIRALVGIICIPICILIFTLLIEGETMRNSKTTEKVKKVVADTSKKKDQTAEKSSGGQLPGFFQIDNPQSDNTPDKNEVVTPPQSTETENQNQNTNGDAKTEEKQ